MTIAIIGGGAAGFFASINCAELHPQYKVIIFEKSNKVLSKVRISGGGRCNVTHACFDNDRLVDFYPRGKKELRNAFARFSTSDTVAWFEKHGVKLKTENDGRMFPVTDNSGTIINCLMHEIEKHHVMLKMNQGVSEIHKTEKGFFELHFQNGEFFNCDRVIITTGGSAGSDNYNWIRRLGHTIVQPVPSLFTFNIPASPLKGLEGISSPSVTMKLAGSKFESTGAVLITHWGLSGPAVLRLSSFAARWMHENNYSVKCILNWFPEMNEERIRKELTREKEMFPNKKISSLAFQGMPSRLWQRLCFISGIEENEKCIEINKIKLNKLAQLCCNMELQVNGKTTFKEEFVTCGGVSLKEVNMQTMESKIVNGIYFAGEVLDIDGITGGFNFQSAWTTGYLAGISQKP